MQPSGTNCHLFQIEDDVEHDIEGPLQHDARKSKFLLDISSAWCDRFECNQQTRHNTPVLAEVANLLLPCTAQYMQCNMSLYISINVLWSMMRFANDLCACVGGLHIRTTFAWAFIPST